MEALEVSQSWSWVQWWGKLIRNGIVFIFRNLASEVISLSLRLNLNRNWDSYQEWKKIREDAEFIDLENSQPIHMVKKWESIFGENTKGEARPPLIRRLVSHLNRSQELLFKAMEECKRGAASAYGASIGCPVLLMISAPLLLLRVPWHPMCLFGRPQCYVSCT